MTYLELCQLLRQEAGISGSGPASVAGQSGINKKIVDWVSRAYEEVQNEETRWRFLWREGSFQTQVGKRDYNPIIDLGLEDFNNWEKHSFFVRRSDSNQKCDLNFLDWEVFRSYSFGAQFSGFTDYTFLPNKTLRLGFEPTAVETIEFEWWRTPDAFIMNSSVPVFPAHHHKVILYKALMYYAADEEAPNIFTDANANYQKRLTTLKQSELMLPSFNLVSLA